MNVFPFKKMFFDIYGTHDYMTFLISACSKDDDEMKALAKLNKKYTDERNESGMIDLLIKIGLLFEKMKGTIDDYLNAIFAYSFAMEKCFLDKYTKIKIELTIKCAKIYVIMSKKEKILFAGLVVLTAVSFILVVFMSLLFIKLIIHYFF